MSGSFLHMNNVGFVKLRSDERKRSRAIGRQYPYYIARRQRLSYIIKLSIHPFDLTALANQPKTFTHSLLVLIGNLT